MRMTPELMASWALFAARLRGPMDLTASGFSTVVGPPFTGGKKSSELTGLAARTTPAVAASIKPRAVARIQRRRRWVARQVFPSLTRRASGMVRSRFMFGTSVLVWLIDTFVYLSSGSGSGLGGPTAG